MSYSRKALACEFGIGVGFVPAHATHWIVALGLGITTQFPTGGTGPACAVHEERHGLVPGDLAAVFEERVLPVFPFAITALVDKRFELPVGHFVLVEPEGRQVDCLAGDDRASLRH